MTKISFVGAGSSVFARKLVADILRFPELADATISLHDIDADRLRTSELVANRAASALGANPRIETTLDRRESLDGADHVITMFQVGGYEPATVIDFAIPKQFGLDQTIADTIGIGGIMRALRTIPVLLEMAAEMEELCGDATLLQYVNPMAMNCWAIGRATSINTIGLCHSVFQTAAHLAADIGVPIDEISYRCAGINHMAFYLEFERRTAEGMVDLYPEIAKFAATQPAPHRGNVSRTDGGIEGLSDAIRYDVFRRFGYFVTESSQHFAEYVPWYIKDGRTDLIEGYGIQIDEYPRRCEEQINNWDTMREELESAAADFDVSDSGEYGAGIIHSIETGQPRVVYGNVPNVGLIDNLPDGCCVEVPCLVDYNGVQPTAVGALPPQLAALMQTNVNVQSLTVEAALTGNRDHVHHAAMLDPHTAAELDLDQIGELVEALLVAHGDWIPEMS